LTRLTEIFSDILYIIKQQFFKEKCYESGILQVLFNSVFTLLFAVVVSVGTAQGATIDQEVFEVAGLQESLKVKVFLTHQPGHQIALAEKQAFQPEFERLSSQVQELIQPFAIGR